MTIESRFATVLALTLAIGASAAPAAADEPKRVLVLHTYGHDAPGRIPFDAALVRALRDVAGVKAELYIESLDPNRFAGEAQTRLTREYLREKYASKKITVLVAVFDEALSFLLDERDALFPTVPIAAVLTRYPTSTHERVAVVWSGNMIGQSVALALKLHPRTRQVAIINSAPPRSDSRDQVDEEIQNQIETIGLSVPVISLRNLDLDALAARVQTLPPDTVIFFARQFIGRRGEPVSHDDALREVVRAARAPIYVSTNQLIGLGAVGGVVINIEDEARQVAALVLKIANGGSLPIPPVESTLLPIFDWRQLRRWGIDERLLPAHSEIQFRKLGVWDQYRWYVVGTLSVCIVQSALIAGLLLSRRRRRRAELALQTSESALHASASQVQSLAGRLIAAQEVERKRIARELHDDLSQKLALLSIDIDRVAFDGAATDGMTRHARAAASRVREIATGVHNLSHELHPARLEMLGLGMALEGLCQEMSAAHHAHIEFARTPIAAAIPEAPALCLFRVAQEALRNVVKHSGAAHAQVCLRHIDGILELQIVDSGRGFSPEAAMNGIGLVSMRERVALIGGEIAVQSAAGMGTRIDVRVPLRGAEAPLPGRLAEYA